mmetsp:Transcript_11259/g.31355  ORF Transcript_11259/g.31355 Transcript_11259/m.31355 type:complete len:86 (-) Transcript_11259:334-591(-)|eukprot:CAMPEP_0113666540 /NCGR_PEP_ID=MMETSP0038_2-20120614/2931_1 /TAXON_ID=2898 /ORGANISM="Cryptomonas paramecium" /LENGTH=85 /DNA_ID=CAMNT_0000582043 /DNA_START=159 /DNA_END=416 /DNA_ORIENTATION=+ /assembly_acc=CAM_ASM_000170
MLSKLLFSKLYSADFAVGYQPDVNPFTEAPVGSWDLPDIILKAPAGGDDPVWAPFNQEAQYYGPMGKAWVFDNFGLSGAGPLGPP